MSVEAATRPKTEGVDSIQAIRWAGVIGFPLLAFLTSQTHWFPWLAFPLKPLGVPMTLQSLWVVLAALCIGPRFGLIAFAGYFLVGVIGVPVFADGGAGPATVLGQTGGYLVGFVACQPVVGWILRRRDGSVRGWLALVVSVVAAHAVIFGCGVPWVYVVHWADSSPISWSRAWYGGAVVFLPGMCLKGAAAVIIGRAVVPWAARRVW